MEPTPTPSLAERLAEEVAWAEGELPSWFNGREDVVRQRGRLLRDLGRWVEEGYFSGLVEPERGDWSGVVVKPFIRDIGDENSEVVLALEVVSQEGPYEQGTVIFPVDPRGGLDGDRPVIVYFGEEPMFFSPSVGGVLPEGYREVPEIVWDWERSAVVAVDHTGRVVALVNSWHRNPEGQLVPDWELLLDHSDH